MPCCLICSLSKLLTIDKDTVAKIDCTPPTYCLSDCHRPDSRGGGTALFYKETLSKKP